MIQIPTRVAGEAMVVQHMMSDVADKAVKQVVKEAYPDASEWVDNQVQDKLGIPIVLPISPELLEATLKGDTSEMAKLWSGLLRTAGIETAKEGARVALCGSITLYGYLTKFEADPLEIHHRTDGDAEGKSLSKLNYGAKPTPKGKCWRLCCWLNKLTKMVKPSTAALSLSEIGSLLPSMA